MKTVKEQKIIAENAATEMTIARENAEKAKLEADKFKKEHSISNRTF